jgi:hypothetical protein
MVLGEGTQELDARSGKKKTKWPSLTNFEVSEEGALKIKQVKFDHVSKSNDKVQKEKMKTLFKTRLCMSPSQSADLSTPRSSIISSQLNRSQGYDKTCSSPLTDRMPPLLFHVFWYNKYYQ